MCVVCVCVCVSVSVFLANIAVSASRRKNKRHSIFWYTQMITGIIESFNFLNENKEINEFWAVLILFFNHLYFSVGYPSLSMFCQTYGPLSAVRRLIYQSVQSGLMATYCSSSTTKGHFSRWHVCTMYTCVWACTCVSLSGCVGINKHQLQIDNISPQTLTQCSPRGTM